MHIGQPNGPSQPCGTTMTDETNAVELAAGLTIAWLGNPNTRTSAGDVPAFLTAMHEAVQRLATPAVPAESAVADQKYVPAVSVRKSLASRDHIISMLDGKPYRTLRRHLATNGLTPEEYRARYKLKPDYPMIAEGYSEERRAMAKSIGLGRKPIATAAQDSPAASHKSRRTLKPSFPADEAKTAE
jgi:predicted transcriptional regulator